ncbi:hypothetical protein [Kordiimonas aestuarii]|nr:hypothetical protein [Kordiimonas aestuarii]
MFVMPALAAAGGRFPHRVAACERQKVMVLAYVSDCDHHAMGPREKMHN